MTHVAIYARRTLKTKGYLSNIKTSRESMDCLEVLSEFFFRECGACGNCVVFCYELQLKTLHITVVQSASVPPARCI